MLNMNELVGTHDIVFITLDTLRFDVAEREMIGGRLPVLNQFIDRWEPRHSPANFTYAAHHAFFAGFFPSPIDNPAAPRPLAVNFNGSRSISENTKCFNASSIVEGLANENYQTVCIGGVGFFNKQTPLSNVLPGMFAESYWEESMGVTDRHSTQNQVNQVIAYLENCASSDETKPIFLFLNISAIHQPNYFYVEGSEKSNGDDDLDSHAAALRYVDSQLKPLFEAFKHRRNTLFFICSDHGTTYGEDGYTGHRLAHENVWLVPYAEFIQERVSC